MVSRPLTREDIEAARARLGLVGGVQQPERPPVAGFLPPVSPPPPSQGGGGLFSRVAGFIPDEIERAVATGLSGERFFNLGPGTLGTDIRTQLERVPRVGGFLGTGFDVAAAPATLIPGAAGGRLSVAAGRGFGGRLAAEAATALGAVAAGGATARGLQEAGARNVPILGSDPVQAIAPLVAGIIAGRRIAKGARAVDEVAEQFGEHAIRPVSRLNRLLEERAVPRRAQITAEQREARAVRFNEIDQIDMAAARGEILQTDALVAKRGILRGELTSRDIEPLRDQFSDADINQMLRIIAETPELSSTAERANLQIAFDALLSGRVPQPAQILAFERVFGPTNFTALRGFVPGGQRRIQQFQNIIGLPRAIQASIDLSAPFRQGILYSTSPQFRGSMRAMFKAAASEEGAQKLMRSIEQDPNQHLFRRMKLEFTAIGRNVDVLKKEEAYRSDLQNRIPLVGGLFRGSDRAYGVFLNELRRSSANKIIREMHKAGITGQEFDDILEQAGKAINITTGRGTIPFGLEGNRAIVNLLGQTFFAPKLLAARFQTLPLAARSALGAVGLQPRAGLLPVRTATKAERILYREMAQNMAGAFTLASSGLALAAAAGIATVELDPRSSDFLKARIGNTSLDPWGGFQPIARYMSQIVTGEQKALGTGDIRDAGRIDLGQRFIESKLAPVPGLLMDVLKGRTFLGEDVQFTPNAEFSDELTSRMLPFFLQDLTDALREEGAMGLVLGFPGAFGLGVQSFRTIGTTREAVAQQAFDKGWTDLTGEQQQDLERAFAAELESARVRTEFSEARDTIEMGIRDREQELFAGLEQGHPSEVIARTLTDLNRERIVATEQAMADFGIVPRDDPNDVVSQIYDKRDEATANGITDFQLLDLLTEEAVANLTTEERLQWEQRRRFIHDPLVQGFFDAKDEIAKAGYWQVQRQAMEKFSAELRRRDPSIQTYQQLVQAIERAEREGDRSRARKLNGTRSRIDAFTRRQRRKLRRADPLLDEALVLIYGLTPIRGR